MPTWINLHNLLIYNNKKTRGISALWLTHSLVGHFNQPLVNFTHSTLLGSSLTHLAALLVQNQACAHFH